jgi:hypothetical protein
MNCNPRMSFTFLKNKKKEETNEEKEGEEYATSKTKYFSPG